MQIRDAEGYLSCLDTRLTQYVEDGPHWKIAQLLVLLIEKAGLTEQELRDCDILDDDETIAPEPKT